MAIKEQIYECENCPYCQRTSDFYTCWCAWWGKVVYLTDECAR